MRRILIFISFSILFRLNAMTMLEVYQNPDQDMKSSFIELWQSNFGDSLDFSIGSDKNLTPEMRKILIERFTESNINLFTENAPYLKKENQLLENIGRLTEDLPLKEDFLNEQKKERSLLLLRKSLSGESPLLMISIDSNRRDIYDLENEIKSLKVGISDIKQQLESVRKFLLFNNMQIRRNKMRISFLGGAVKEETIEIKATIPEVSAFKENLPLYDPETLSHYSLAAMEGIRLEKCPKHDNHLEYTFRMVEDSYKGIKYSYPLYAGWCSISNEAYIYREADDESKKVVIEVRNKKMKQIDEMLKKS